jgi:hypothetical protein
LIPVQQFQIINVFIFEHHYSSPNVELKESDEGNEYGNLLSTSQSKLPRILILVISSSFLLSVENAWLLLGDYT